jgi:2-amino-4-hydroxy-6-hydroxymethyldihydropteridine diphosphokinase
MNVIYLSLGSNIGRRLDFIKAAVDKLSEHIKIIEKSALYETAPWGKTNQPKFLNLCLKAETDLNPNELLSFVKEVELGAGRNSKEKWGPREIDVDILFYDDDRLQSKNLTIPHPHLHERAFVLVPLNEIAADFIHPVLKKSVAELTKNVSKSGVEKYAS